MKNTRLYGNYSGSDKILVDMNNQVYDINCGKVTNFAVIDLF